MEKRTKIQTIITHLYNDNTSASTLITYNSKEGIESKKDFNVLDKNLLIKQLKRENAETDEEAINALSQRLLEDLRYTSDRVKQILLVILIIEKIYELHKEYIDKSIYTKSEKNYGQKENIQDDEFDNVYQNAINYVSQILNRQNTTVENKLTQQIDLKKDHMKRLIKYYIHKKDAKDKIDTPEYKKYSYNLKEYLEEKAPAKGYHLADKEAINKYLRNFDK